MKHLFRLSALLLSITFAFNSISCKKKTEESSCKTCTAFGIDGQAGKEEVCSDAAEDAFRTKYAGKEISCR
jgi:hypothetical protein